MSVIAVLLAYLAGTVVTLLLSQGERLKAGAVLFNAVLICSAIIAWGTK